MHESHVCETHDLLVGLGPTNFPETSHNFSASLPLPVFYFAQLLHAEIQCRFSPTRLVSNLTSNCQGWLLLKSDSSQPYMAINSDVEIADCGGISR